MFELLYPGSPAPVLPKQVAGVSEEAVVNAAEMLPIVRENGLVYAQATRAYCHGGSMLLHPVVHLHIINRFDQLYLQKRSMKKDLLPGMWDTAVGGHVDYGEYISEALFRESSEELKFTEYNPIWLGNYVFHSNVECELDEVEEGRYWPMEEIEENIGESIFTPNFESEFRRIRKSLEALL